MYILWVVFMGLVIAWLAVPLARRLGWRYGRFGRARDMALVMAGALLGGVLLSTLLGLIGLFAGGTEWALILGFAGAMVTVVLLVIFSTRETIAEEADAERTNSN